MTKYETIALILSFVAILIPIAQWLWGKYIVKAKLAYYPTGKAYLFINNSGSYIRIEGVFEAQNKSVSVKKVSVKIIRKNDDKVLNLDWAAFVSPMNQTVLGLYSSTLESAHPFKIEKDSVSCAYLEFENRYNSAYRKIYPISNRVRKDISWIVNPKSEYEKALIILRHQDSYREYMNALNAEMYWAIGRYDVELQVQYDKKTVEFKMQFEITREQYDDLKNNIEEVLTFDLKEIYKQGHGIKSVQVDVSLQ